MADKLGRLMIKNQSKETNQETTACKLESAFTDDGFSTQITMSKRHLNDDIQIINLTIHEAVDLMRFLKEITTL
jgi:hypothetical protein